MNPESYFTRLSTRLNEAKSIPFRDVHIGEWNPEPNKCHDNVNRYVENNQKCRAVRGWLLLRMDYNAGYIFIAHSIVREGKTLFDITPLERGKPENKNLVYLQHEGTEEEFDSISKAIPQHIFTTLPPDTLF